MDQGNQSVVSEFVLLGLSPSWNMQVLLLMIFLMIYLTIAVENIFIVILILTDLHLHSPMYFLLVNFSFIDMLLSSVTTPKMITDFLKEIKTISLGGCMCQIIFVHFIGGGEMVLLVVTVYDHYVAFCNPLHYSTIPCLQKHIGLVVTSWTLGFVHAMSLMAVIAQLLFCGLRKVDTFFCDIPLVIKLPRMDSYNLRILMNSDSGLLTITSFRLLLISYTHILLTVQQSYKKGALKALSTCTAHITVLILFFGPCIFIYVWPLSITWVDKFIAVLYSVLTPLLNPPIYTLRNKEIKNAKKRFQIYHINFKGYS